MDSCPYVPDDPNKAVGIDLGLKDFSTSFRLVKSQLSQVLRKYEKQLGKVQRIMSRRTKGGSNWDKARIKVARNSREDY